MREVGTASLALKAISNGDAGLHTAVQRGSCPSYLTRRVVTGLEGAQTAVIVRDGKSLALLIY